MKTDITKATAEAAEGTLFLGDDWFDPLEAGVRTRIRGFGSARAMASEAEIVSGFL